MTHVRQPSSESSSLMRGCTYHSAAWDRRPHHKFNAFAPASLPMWSDGTGCTCAAHALASVKTKSRLTTYCSTPHTSLISLLELDKTRAIKAARSAPWVLPQAEPRGTIFTRLISLARDMGSTVRS